MFHSTSLGAYLLVSAVTILLLPGALAQDQPKKAGEKLITVAYDVSDIVAKRKAWDLGEMFPEQIAPGRAVTAAEALPKFILEALPHQAVKFVGKNARHTMQLVSSKTLEIHTDKNTHEEVKDQLAALRSLLDVAVIVDCELYELDRKTYEQQIVAKMNRLPGQVAVFAARTTDEFEERLFAANLKVAQLSKRMQLLKSNKVTLQVSEPSEIFSWRTVVPYEKSPARIFLKKETAFAFPGFSFSMTPVVTADRRKTRLKLTQQVTQLAEWQKVKALQAQPNQDLKEVFFEIPVIQEFTFTNTFEVWDGASAAVQVQWQRPGDKDKILLLVVSPRILIEAEERIIQEALKKEKK